MKVFWSWQNDVTPKANRHFIRDALDEAVKRVGDELGLEEADRPELDHDTKNTPGMADITATILKKISNAAVFVADLTPVGETSAGKALPNPNVLVELGWALSKLGPDPIIGVLNTAHGYGPEHLPFDVRQRRTMLYNLAADADSATRKAIKQKLTNDLTAALRTNLRDRAENQAALQEVRGVAAKPGDPSIWASATRKIEHHDTTRGTVSCHLPSCGRGYIRIIPAGWKNGIPSVNDIANIPFEQAVQPQPEGTREGDFSVCEQGYVRYWLTDILSDEDFEEEFETRNVAMWFDETGEFWVIHGTAIDEGRGGRKTLRVPSLIRGWHDSLHRATAVFDRLGALPVRKVEAGLSDVQGVLLPGQFSFETIPARRAQCVHSLQQREWNDEAQLAFRTAAYNKVRDLFALPRLDQGEVRKLLPAGR